GSLPVPSSSTSTGGGTTTESACRFSQPAKLCRLFIRSRVATLCGDTDQRQSASSRAPLRILHPRPIRYRAHHSVQTGHDGGQLVEQVGGRPCQSSTFRFVLSIEIIP